MPKVDVKEKETTSAPVARLCNGRAPRVGDQVWCIIREHGQQKPLPAILQHEQMDGSWGFNYFREGTLVWVSHATYCGSEWVDFGWCWPGEEPKVST